MFIRALGSVLTRRFSSPAISCTRAQPQASSPGIFSRTAVGATPGRPGRSLRTFRDLDFNTAHFLSAIAAGLVSLGGLWYLKKGTDHEPVAAELTLGNINKEAGVVDVYDPKDPAVMATFVDKDGKMNWADYYDYLNEQKYGGTGKAYSEKELLEEELKKSENSDPKEEAVIKERFEQWMKEHKRKYKTEEEKRMRYAVFRRRSRIYDEHGFGKLGRIGDLFEDEYQSPYKSGNIVDYKELIDVVNDQTARGWLSGGHMGNLSVDPKRMEMVRKQAENCRREAKNM